MNHLRPLRPSPRPVVVAVLAVLVLAVLLLARTDLRSDPAAPATPAPAGFQVPGT